MRSSENEKKEGLTRTAQRFRFRRGEMKGPKGGSPHRKEATPPDIAPGSSRRDTGAHLKKWKTKRKLQDTSRDNHNN